MQFVNDLGRKWRAFAEAKEGPYDISEEREWIDKLINLGYVDVFRKFNNKPNQYTYWDQVTRKREKNLGWRIDYFMVSNDFVDKVTNAKIYMDVMGSDHCPISIELEL